MSCLAKLQETREWLASWRAKSPRTALRHVERAAQEQRANYESCVQTGRWPSGWSSSEYRQCVELIEAAIPSLKEEVRRLDELAAEKEAADQEEAERNRQALLARHKRR